MKKIFEGYTEKELKDTFNKIYDPTDWKRPTYKRIEGKDLNITLSSIRFYTDLAPKKVTKSPVEPNVFIICISNVRDFMKEIEKHS